MSVIATALVDGGALVKVVVASLVAGIGVTAAFSLAISGAVRFVDLRRDGRGIEAMAFALVAMVALAACGAAIGYGILLMTEKS